MLPELFSVGSTMQEDFGFLSVNNCFEKATTSNPNTSELVDLESTNSTSFNKISLQHTKVKLEDSPEINKWPFNYGINFLRTSDDPMISSVNQEIEQHENELLRRDSTSTNETPSTPQSPSFEVVTSRQTQKSQFQMNRATETTATSTQSAKTQRTSTRARRKGPLKLRFHHQALPPEYLNHYESQQENIRQQQQSQQQQQPAMPKKKSPAKAHVSLAPPPVADKSSNDVKANNENIINWLQNILEMQSNDEAKPVPKIRNIPIEVAPTSSRTQSLNDLPYMGEMTLENMKPRRGRKPKKADICHLIYKNYGTIVPGSVAVDAPKTTTSVSAAKKSTEGSKKKSALTTSKKVKESRVGDSTKTLESEPLNLCVRETKSEETSILISDDNEDPEEQPLNRGKTLIDSCETDSIDLEFSSTIPSLISPLDLSGDLPSNSKNFPRAHTVTPPLSTPTSTSTPTTPSVSGAPPGYIYWPSAGLFIHPMALYYQKMMDGKMNPDSSNSSSTSSLSSMLNNEANTLWEQNMSCGLDLKSPDFDMENISQMIKTENAMCSPPPVLSEMLKNIDTKKNSSSQNNQKRKRSAIFIPPVQSDSPNNPTNEVSICKFKFTGGARPSLQEKKILSVDAGGNFRYFSGTGDKSMRGYEFFPRESLRQSSLIAGSHTNAFLNAASEKIPLDLLPPISADLNTKLLNLAPEIDPTKNMESNYDADDVQMTLERSEDRASRKKKSSNRSIQRAKLEKTFKEKGFLIQTQQLQSAEGATYCKFRQLRKFTRYLFRSWKDYLPTDENGARTAVEHDPSNLFPQCPTAAASSP